MRFLFLTLIISISYNSFAQVSVRDTSIQWQHFDYELDAYYGLATYSNSDIVTSTYQGLVLENKWVKLCVIPEFGGRIISYIYKPTGKEQLYQNPVGVPYQIGTGVFYHDWLMVYGGIFPTFPDPEHGKYWHTPWKSELINESPNKITIAMSQIDTLNNPAHPGQYSGVTGITCRYKVSLEANKPYFTVDVELENDDSPDNYEYWTCITFAPGSETGNTFTPGNSEMIVPIEQYKMGWNPNNWMADLDELISNNGERVMAYENLAHLSNWEDMGIAYAYPDLKEPYYGVINHDNEQGMFRISNDQSTTPGLKFWTWGNEQGLNANPNDFNQEARPYIELWSGVSNEFFEKSFLAANEKVNFTETYFPTVGIPSIDYMSNEIAFSSQLEEELLNIYSFYPVASSQYSIEFHIIKGLEELYTNTYQIVADPEVASLETLDLKTLDLPESALEIEIALFKNDQLISTKLYNFNGNVLSNTAKEVFDPILSLVNNEIQISFEQAMMREIALYDLEGRELARRVIQKESASLPFSEAGIYIVMVAEENRLWSKKIAVR